MSEERKPVPLKGVISAICATGVVAGQTLALAIGVVWALSGSLGLSSMGFYICSGLVTLVIVYGAFKYGARAIAAEREYN